MLAIQSDAGDFNAAQAAVDEVVDAWGKLDVLVNNAGITKDQLLMRMSEADFDAVMDTNLKSVFNMTKAVMRTMLKQRSGSIINMSSVVGVQGNAGQANYAASKAGDHRLHQERGHGAGQPQHPQQRHSTGFHRDGNDRRLGPESRWKAGAKASP